MEEVIGRLKNVNMYLALIHVYFNVYFMTKVYFECGIVSITNSQEKNFDQFMKL